MYSPLTPPLFHAPGGEYDKRGSLSSTFCIARDLPDATREDGWLKWNQELLHRALQCVLYMISCELSIQNCRTLGVIDSCEKDPIYCLFSTLAKHLTLLLSHWSREDESREFKWLIPSLRKCMTCGLERLELSTSTFNGGHGGQNLTFPLLYYHHDSLPIVP